MITALLFATPVHALDVPHAAHLGGPVTTGRGALLTGVQVLALIAGSLVSVAAGSIWVEDNFRVHGRPDPLVFSGSIAIAMALNMALTWLLLPDFARVTNDSEGTVEVAYVQRELWKPTRWVALASAFFIGVLIVGSAIEKNDFGKGQAILGVGAGGALLSALAFDVTSLLTVRSATNTSRQLSPAP